MIDDDFLTRRNKMMREADRMERNFWRAFWVILAANIVFLGLIVALVVVLLRHFGVI